MGPSVGQYEEAKQKRHQLSNSHKQLLAAGDELFEMTFTDTPEVWTDFSKKRMAQNMNVFVRMLAMLQGGIVEEWVYLLTSF